MDTAFYLTERVYYNKEFRLPVFPLYFQRGHTDNIWQCCRPSLELCYTMLPSRCLILARRVLCWYHNSSPPFHATKAPLHFLLPEPSMNLALCFSVKDKNLPSRQPSNTFLCHWAHKLISGQCLLTGGREMQWRKEHIPYPHTHCKHTCDSSTFPLPP